MGAPSAAYGPLELLRGARGQWLPFATVGGATLAFIAVALRVEPTLFRPVIGDADPLVMGVAIASLGAAALAALLARGWVNARGPRIARGSVHAATLAVCFGAVAVVADTAIRYPADMNVPLPMSLLFYPVIAFVAEVLFHLVPLAVLLEGLAAFARHRRLTVYMLGLALTALIEPAYQTWISLAQTPVVGAPSVPSLQMVAFTAMQVLAINGAQMLMFRRYGFLPMYLLRLTYYLIWHIAWGYLRINVLF